MDEPTRASGPLKTSQETRAGNSGTDQAVGSRGGLDGETIASRPGAPDATIASRGGPAMFTSRGGGPPRTLGGYEIEKEISRGGQGVVYKAFQAGTKRPTALKLMLTGEYATEASLLRFQREIETTGSLKHANIVTVYAAEFVGDQPMLAMEWIDGVPAHEWCTARRVSAAGVRTILELFLKICDAIHYAHQRGIIHRDLKPNNVLVDAAGEPHLLDFGLAKLTKPDASRPALTVSEDFLGTPAYAAPEQLKSDPNAIDVRTDEYALALVLQQMLTDDLPYDIGNSFVDLIKAIEGADPIPASRQNALVDDDVDAVIAKALSKEPQHRYPSVDAMAADLRRFLGGEPIEAKRDRAMYVLRKTLRRHRTAVRVAMGVFTLVVAFAVTMALLYRRAVTAEGDAREALAQTQAAKSAEESARVAAQGEAANAKFRLEAARREVATAQAEFDLVARDSLRAAEFEQRLSPADRRDFPRDALDGTAPEVTRLFPEWWGEADDADTDEPAEPVSVELRIALETCLLDPDHASLEPLSAWLRDHADRLDTLERLTRERRIDWPHRQSGPLLFQAIVPRLNDARLMTELLCADACRLGREGRTDAAIERLRAARRVARYAGDHATMLHALVSLMARLEVYAAVRWVSVAAASRGETSAALTQFMREDPPPARLDVFLAAEARGLRQAIADSFTRRRAGAPPVLDLQSLRPFIEYSGDADASAIETRRFSDSHITFESSMAAVADLTRLWSAAQDLDFAGLARAEQDFRERVRDDALMAAIAVNWRPVLDLHRAAVVSRDATNVTLELCRERVSTGRWPANIDASAAHDAGRTSAGILRYVLFDSAPLLYCDGNDLTDDGGRIAADVQPPMPGGDFIYLAPPPTASANRARRQARKWADEAAAVADAPSSDAFKRAAALCESLTQDQDAAAIDWLALGRLYASNAKTVSAADAAFARARQSQPAMDDAWIEHAQFLRRRRMYADQIALLAQSVEPGRSPARVAALCLALAACEDATLRDPARSAALAEEALSNAEQAPDSAYMVPVLRSVAALAHLREKRFDAAVDSLLEKRGGEWVARRDVRLGAREGLVLAIALHVLGHTADAADQWRHARRAVAPLLASAELVQREYELPELMREAESAFGSGAE